MRLQAPFVNAERYADDVRTRTVDAKIGAQEAFLFPWRGGWAQASAMETKEKPAFDPKAFLATRDRGRTISKYQTNQILFSQGDRADSVFYISDGKVKIIVLSEQGKEAVVAILGPDQFCGEGCLAGQPRRMATAIAMTRRRG